MILDHPVQCLEFCQAAFNIQRPMAWCIILSPQAEVLHWFEFEHETPSLYQVVSHIKIESLWNRKRQILIIRFDPSQGLLNQDDWLWIEALKKLLGKTSLVFCDYLKVSKEHFTSVSEFLAHQ